MLLTTQSNHEDAMKNFPDKLPISLEFFWVDIYEMLSHEFDFGAYLYRRIVNQ